MKKEIGIEKLIELLNEYERSKRTNLEITNWKCIYGNLSYFGYGNGYSELLCISNRYGFIKWLVENNKIDLDKVKENGIKHNGKMDIDGLYRYSVYERVLMLLSISSSPIEDLILYLK